MAGYMVQRNRHNDKKGNELGPAVTLYSNSIQLHPKPFVSRSIDSSAKSVTNRNREITAAEKRSRVKERAPKDEKGAELAEGQGEIEDVPRKGLRCTTWLLPTWLRELPDIHAV